MNQRVSPPPSLSRASARASSSGPAFTLIELLVTVAVIALLISVLLPALAGARTIARTAVCLSNQRQLVTAWTLYANASRDRVMPLAYWSEADIGPGPQVYWWGTHGSATEPPDYSRGFLAPYLDTSLAPRSVLECPEQAWGTYRPQGPSRTITSTYGYNGYYLSPAKTPGWGAQIANQRWKRLGEIERSTDVFVFADALLPGSTPSNTALLDPPQLFTRGSGWRANNSPTTAFRHGRRGLALGSSPGRAVTARVDGSVRPVVAAEGSIVDQRWSIGSVVVDNSPSYVPDWRDWR